jgi:hypothetical protein
MRKQLHLMMGIAEDASAKEMKQEYQRLMTALFELDLNNPRYDDRLRRARQKLSDAFEANKRFENSKRFEKSVLLPAPTSDEPKLGELLIEAGAITREQLETALAAQAQAPSPIPIGRLLVHSRIISWDQLAFYLRIQDLLKLDPHSKERLSRQLLDLGLISQGELDIAKLDCETVGCTLEHAICKRGWLKPELIQELTAAAARAKNPEPVHKTVARIIPQTPRLNTQTLRNAAPLN